jgi:hypothetical protein
MDYPFISATKDVYFVGIQKCVFFLNDIKIILSHTRWSSQKVELPHKTIHTYHYFKWRFDYVLFQGYCDGIHH